jgi:hypothetical protein
LDLRGLLEEIKDLVWGEIHEGIVHEDGFCVREGCGSDWVANGVSGGEAIIERRGGDKICVLGAHLVVLGWLHEHDGRGGGGFVMPVREQVNLKGLVNGMRVVGSAKISDINARVSEEGAMDLRNVIREFIKGSAERRGDGLKEGGSDGVFVDG